MEQTGRQRWCPLWWQLLWFGRITLGRFVLKVLENLLNDLGVFDAGNDLDVTATIFTNLDIDIEDAL